MNKSSTKVLLGIVIVFMVLGGVYLYNKQVGNNNQTPTQPTTSTSNVITPEKVAIQDTLQANVTYRDDKSGYEFTPFENMNYSRVEIEKERRITLSSDTGRKTTTTNEWIGWPRLEIGGAVAFTANDKLPDNYDLLAEVKKYYVPTEFSDPLPSQPNCRINNTPCVKIATKATPGVYAGEDIYLVTQGYLLRIHLNDTSTKEARDYYDKFLSSFKVVPAN